MSDLPFSSEHKARFQELRTIGELCAVNGHSENLEFGPWHVICDLTDSDTAFRLNARFRAAAQKAAMAAGAPCRVNRRNWWIGKLTHGKPLGFKDLPSIARNWKPVASSSDERRQDPTSWEGSTATGTRVTGASPMLCTMGRPAPFQIQRSSSSTGPSTSGVVLACLLRNWTRCTVRGHDRIKRPERNLGTA